MAINIKELFDADSDNIKVEKTNYNFDQVLANGGGPIGPKGVQGTTGNVGQKGDEGDKGNKGDGGQKGEQGVSLNIWDSDVSQSGTPFNVLRPFNVSGPIPSGARTSRIILGDDTGNGTPPTSPSYSPTALLSMLLKADDAPNHIELKVDNSQAAIFNVRSEYFPGTGTTLKIVGSSAAVQGETVNMTINPGNNITLIGDTLDLNASKAIQITSSGSNVTIEGDTGVSIDGQNGNILIDNTSGSGDITVSSSEDLNLNASSLTITANGGGTNDNINITSNSGDITLTALNDQNITIGSYNDTQSVNISSNTNIYVESPEIELTGDDFLVNVNNEVNINSQNESLITSGLATIINTTASGGKIDLRIQGSSKFKIEDTLNTSFESIFFNQDGNTIDQTTSTTVLDDGEGIEFLEGGIQVQTFGTGGGFIPPMEGLFAAPNNGKSKRYRVLSDYFHSQDWSEFSIKSIDTSLGGGSRGDLTSEPSGVDVSVNTFYTNSLTSEGSYVKIGDRVEGHGIITGSTNNGWNAQLNSGNLLGRSLYIDIEPNNPSNVNYSEVNHVFPYKNSSAAPVMCDFAITTNSSNSTLGEYPQFKGIIYPNSSRIYLYRLYYSSSKLFVRALSPADVYGSNGTSFELSFNFSFPSTTQNSYNREYLYKLVNTLPSDRLIKKNIVKIGQSPNGYNIYEFEFIDNISDYFDPVEVFGEKDLSGMIFQGAIADELPSNFTEKREGEDFCRVYYGQDAVDIEFKFLRYNV